MTRKTQTVDELAATRLQPVFDRLDEIGAVLLSEWEGKRNVRTGKRDTWWLYSTKTSYYLLQVHPGDEWEVWKPVTDKNDVKTTLAAIV